VALTVGRSASATRMRGQPSARPDRRRETTDAAYAAFAPLVRARLAAFGVRLHDVADLCHDVFVIAHTVGDLTQVKRVDLWLTAVCRRVAAGYRRRSGRRREILGFDAADFGSAAEAWAQAENAYTVLARNQEEEGARRAFEQLDQESRELLVLHDVVQLPLTALAQLVEHDRKTVRKRIEVARRRVSQLMLKDEKRATLGPRLVAERESDNHPPGHAQAMALGATIGKKRGPAARELEIMSITPSHTLAILGNVVLSHWPSAITEEGVEAMIARSPRIVERCGGELVGLVVLGPEYQPPPQRARARIVDALRTNGPYNSGHAIVWLGGLGALAEPLMSGLMLLAQAHFPVQFFRSVGPAAAWLSQFYARGADGPLSAAHLCAAAARVQRLRP